MIPQYRGKFRSRRFESVISEATRLFSQGVREINLIGQDTTCYGEDFGLKDGLALLLARLAQIETDHAKWVRFLYCYPNKVTQKLLDTIAEHAALVKYIDMPLQHASAPVLKRMKRGANGDIFLKLLEKHPANHSRRCHSHQHDRRLSGRDRSGFQRTVPVRRGRAVRPAGSVLLLRRRHQQEFRAGRQSGRPHHLEPQTQADGDPAQDFPRAQSALVGRRGMAVLVEGPSADSELVWQARLSTQAPDIDGVCYISDPGEAPLRAGEFRRMRITKAHDYDLTGELMADTEARQARQFRVGANQLGSMRCPICRKVVPL